MRYSRCINFTLLAPSIWPLIEAFSNTEKKEGYERYLCKTSQNTGIIYEVFLNKKIASDFGFGFEVRCFIRRTSS